MCVVVGDVVDDSGDAGVDVAAAEFFRGDDFAGGGFHERGPAEEDGALVADDDGFVAHGGHVGAAGSAGAEDRGDLRDAALRHGGLVVEDAAEVVAVGEDFVLHGQERAAGVDEVDARQVVVQGDFLGAEVFFDGHRIVAAAFDGGVVGDDDGFASGDASDAGDDPCGGCVVPVGAVHAVGGERGEVEEGRARVEEGVAPFAGEEFAAGFVAFAGVRGPAAGALARRRRSSAARARLVSALAWKAGLVGSIAEVSVAVPLMVPPLRC